MHPMDRDIIAGICDEARERSGGMNSWELARRETPDEPKPEPWFGSDSIGRCVATCSRHGHCVGASAIRTCGMGICEPWALQAAEALKAMEDVRIARALLRITWQMLDAGGESMRRSCRAGALETAMRFLGEADEDLCREADDNPRDFVLKYWEVFRVRKAAEAAEKG